MINYNIQKLHKELVSAGIPITGVYSYTDEITHEVKVGVHFTTEDARETHLAQANAIIEAHLPYDYRTFRVKHYWPVGDQLDAQYKGGEEEQAWRDHITAVKTRWAKNYADLSQEDKLLVDNYYQNGGQ